MLAERYETSNEKVFLTENGRSGLYMFLRSLGLPEGAKVGVQPFTCNSVVNPILWNKYEPIYVDIEYETLNISHQSLSEVCKEHKLSAIIVQHTFGRAADVDKIRAIVGEKCVIIEDCAHTLRSRADKHSVGLNGDAALLSFGLEKVLSTKVGGALIVNNTKLIERFAEEYSKESETSPFRTFIWLLNPFLRAILRKGGKLSAVIIPKLVRVGLFNIGFTDTENVGGMPKYLPAKMSNPTALVAAQTIHSEGDSIQQLRGEQSEIYNEQLKEKMHLKLQDPVWEGPYLKFPVYLQNREQREFVKKELRALGHYISEWYDPVIYPAQTDLVSMNYQIGSCPAAEKASDTVLNLPTGKAFNLQIIDDLEKILNNLPVNAN